ncbi:MAG: hypothetical protein IJF12_00730 [Alphaproteobacteria bacterium]|nr:hypothetical protein [Alphaproteobacteria bacterium]
MRKYFLTCAVALLATTNVNAASYAEIQMLAKVTEANSVECTPLNFGHIVLDGNNDSESYVKILMDNVEISDTDRVISVTDYTSSYCTGLTDLTPTASFPSYATLTGPNGNLNIRDFKLYTRDEGGIDNYIGATLYFYDDTSGGLSDHSGDYEGTVTVTFTY